MVPVCSHSDIYKKNTFLGFSFLLWYREALTIDVSLIKQHVAMIHVLPQTDVASHKAWSNLKPF